ncbi:MAG: ShlB/FhaC/HecB family hemolysin secretion/activation protein [Methylococcaceae bacterium]|nr:ShlB/FhaC/HecB family hemolysin secretion/activation protein [Methylococcaceae bacterium]
MSEGSKRYAGGFALPATDWGTQIFFRFDEVDSLVIEAPFKPIDIKSTVHNLEGGISHAFINTLKQHFSMGVMLAVRSNDTSGPLGSISFTKGTAEGHNQATVWRLFQDYTYRWERQVLALRSTFSVGMNALGATPEHKPSDQDSEFFAWLGQGQFAWRLMDNGAQALLRGNMQLSNEALLPLERIAVGGFQTVRGYRENQLVRDEGFSVSAEFHYPLWGGTDANAQHKLTLVSFMDYGRAWNHGEAAKELHSVGLGLDWQFKPVRASLYYGYAINTPQPQKSDDLQDDGLHFQVGVDIL